MVADELVHDPAGRAGEEVLGVLAEQGQVSTGSIAAAGHRLEQRGGGDLERGR